MALEMVMDCPDELIDTLKIMVKNIVESGDWMEPHIVVSNSAEYPDVHVLHRRTNQTRLDLRETHTIFEHIISSYNPDFIVLCTDLFLVPDRYEGIPPSEIPLDDKSRIVTLGVWNIKSGYWIHHVSKVDGNKLSDFQIAANENEARALLRLP